MKVTVCIWHIAVKAVRVDVVAVINAVGFPTNDGRVLGPGQGLGNQIDFGIHFRFNMFSDNTRQFEWLLILQ